MLSFCTVKKKKKGEHPLLQKMAVTSSAVISKV